MGIGSSYEYPAQKAAALATTGLLTTASPWSGQYPNPPDLNFNYRKLVEGDPIASTSKPNLRIAVVGAGITGLTTARELLRCGFTNLTLFEASDRIGGRHYTVTNVAKQGSNRTYSPFEMAAMRMPFFNTSDQMPLDGMSLLAMYTKEFSLSFENFPNPGTKYVNGTGIYLQEGLISSSQPELIIWKNPDGNTPPPDAKLKAVYDKWRRFHDAVVDVIAPVYGTAAWDTTWQKIVDNYKNMSFREFVKAPVSNITSTDWGGLGLNDDESNIFYSIGFGDGSWGAFFDVCAIYPLRTALFGFSSNLQLIHGRFNEDGTYNPGPHAGDNPVSDSSNTNFEAPQYIGVKSFDDCMLFLPLPGTSESLYDHLKKSSSGLLTSTTVNGLEKLSDGATRITYAHSNGVTGHADFDAVVMTIPSWLIEMNIELKGYSQSTLPFDTLRSWKTAHWETSCKVYAPLDPKFFSAQGNKIPQILVTDTYSHDLYAYKYGVGGYQYPAILVSYTWEDDATKMLSFNNVELIDKCLKELDRALLRCTNVGQSISEYVLKDKVEVMQWITRPNSLGCAKLYRAGTYSDAMNLLAYNANFSAQSGLYLSGESFSVDAGWTEPSFRGAIDAVINICANTGAIFNKGFRLQDYPKYHIPS